MNRALNIILSTSILSAILFLTACSGGNEFGYARDCLIRVQDELDSGESDFSIDRLNYAYNYFRKSKNNEMRAWSHYLNSVVRQMAGLGSDSEWHDDIVEACEYVDKTDNHRLAAKIYMEYGRSMINHRWYDSALPLLNRCRDEAAQAGDYETEVLALMNISRTYMLGGIGPDCDEDALKYSSQAVRLATKHGDISLMARSRYSLSACYQHLGYYEEALAAARHYTRLSEQMFRNGQRKESVRYIQLSRCFHLLGNADSAMVYAKKDLTHEDINARISANQVLAAIHSELTGDSLAALTYNSRYYLLRDTLNSITQNDVILANKGKQELLKARHTTLKLVIIILAAFVSVSIITLRIIRELRRRIEANEKNLAAKENAISDLEGNVDQLTKSVMDKEKQVDTLKIVILDNEDLIHTLKQKPHYLKDGEWAQLKDKVERLEPGFLKQASKYGLTEYASRLLTATKLGFTTAECAKLFSIDPKSITKAKQRLKAKMST